jgi:transposase InsO family protein
VYTLAKLSRAGMLEGCSLTPASFVQARKAQVCEPCMIGEMRRTSHPSRPSQKVQVLHRVHMDLCKLAPGCYFSTTVDEATRFVRVGILHRKSDTAAEVRTQVVWCETQTGKRVQRVRHDLGGEYMSGQLQTFFAERGIQQEPTAGKTPEANGLGERHNLTLLDIALPMLADSSDPQRGLPPLGAQYAGAAVIYANDLHNATPAPSALVGCTPHEGSLHRNVGLSAFQRFGCRVWVHSPSHRQKLAPRALPGRSLGFERPFSSGVVLALLDSGHVTQSQTVEFGDEPRFLAPVLSPKEPASVDAADQEEDNDDSDNEVDLRTAELPSAPPPVPVATVQPPDDESDNQVNLQTA